MKYDTELRLDFNNTMSIMIGEIESNSTVLEFGPASGRLTKYLKNEKECDVYIVELDEEAGKIASEFARDTVIGDIEKYEWLDKFKGITFDYILFADVLEHLRNPEQVLLECKEILSEDGFILISLPNIAHNSVIIDLIKGKFEYQSTGLLDNTHIRFWTYETIEQVMKKLGLYVDSKFATYTQVGKNEFNNTYEDIKFLNPLVLKSRDMGEVYQYVYKVTKKQVQNQRNEIRRNNEYYYIQWYFDYGNGLDDSQGVRKYIDFNLNNQQIIIDTPHNLNKIRIDPINCPCAIRITKLVGVKESVEEVLEIESSNADFTCDEGILFLKKDSQFYLDIEDKDLNSVIIEFSFVLVDENLENNDIIKGLLKQVDNFRIIAEQKENFINEEREKIVILQKELSGYQKEIECFQSKLNKRQTEVEYFQSRLNEQQEEMENVNIKIKEQSIDLENQQNKVNNQQNELEDKQKEINKIKSFLDKPIIKRIYEMYLKKH